MTQYYPECDGKLFDKNLPTELFKSDAEAVEHYKQKYGSLLMAVVKDAEQISVVYSR